MASLCWFCGSGNVWVSGAVKVEIVVSLVPFFLVCFGAEYSAQKVAEAVLDLSSSTGSRPLAWYVAFGARLKVVGWVGPVKVDSFCSVMSCWRSDMSMSAGAEVVSSTWRMPCSP